MNEVSYILTGERQGNIWYVRRQQKQIGQPTSVEFDWAWVLVREEKRADILGFYHTHPTGLASPSQRDVQTMQVWVSCLGKPLLCVIESDSALVAYVFQTDEDEGQRLTEVQHFADDIIIGYLHLTPVV